MSSVSPVTFNSFMDKLPTEGYYFLFVFHLSKNNEMYLKSWVQHCPTIAVISIPYSEQKEVKANIEKYTTVYSPELNKIPGLLQELCNKNKDKKVILVEIGGYSASLLHTLSNVVLVVEDTVRGHRNFEENSANIHCPIVSIARADIKSVENKKVGEVIARSVLLLSESLDIEKPRVLLLSYGNVGKYVALEFRNKGISLYVYDSDAIKRKNASQDRYIVLDRNEALSKADIIVGCTGNRSVDTADIPFIKDGCLLISGSSRQVEFPYEELRSHIIASRSDLPVEEIKYLGKTLYLAYEGQPLNFYYDLSLGDVFEVPMSALVQSVIYGLSGKADISLHDLPADQQKIVAQAFPKEIMSL